MLLHLHLLIDSFSVLGYRFTTVVEGCKIQSCHHTYCYTGTNYVH